MGAPRVRSGGAAAYPKTRQHDFETFVMPPGNITFGGGVNESQIGMGVLIFMIAATLLMFLLPRRFVLVPLLFGAFLIPSGQTLVLAGVHVFAYRIVILAGLMRAVISRPPEEPLFGSGYNSVDRFCILWTLFHATAFILQFQAMGAVVNQVGFLWDVLGGYLVVRFLIRDEEDVQRTIKILVFVAAVLGTTMLFEKFSHVNPYSFPAGHPIIPEIRNGSVRAQGPFHHAILAGTFGATLIPLFYWLWKSGQSKFFALVGMASSAAIAFSAVSSTPVGALLAGIGAICFWPIRRNMRLIRWGIVIGIIALNFMMHAPVWWAIEHIDFAGGSAGEHRAELVDNFIRHFGDWWLIGTHDNVNWGFEMWDLSNEYIAEGETGGLATFICLLAVIVLSFRRIGKARKAVDGEGNNEWYFWLLGAALFSHCVAFFGISYFDQTRLSWFALLAMIQVATAPVLARQSAAEPADAMPRLKQLARSSRVRHGELNAAGPPWKRLPTGRVTTSDK